MSKKLRMSYTKLSFYLACPKRYYYRYVEKRPYYPHVMARYGSNIHRSLKDFSEAITAGKPIDKDAQVILYEKQWTNVSKDVTKNLELKNLGIKQLQDFVDLNIRSCFVKKRKICQLVIVSNYEEETCIRAI